MKTSKSIRLIQIFKVAVACSALRFAALPPPCLRADDAPPAASETSNHEIHSDEIATLIRDLGAKDYFTRQRASERLQEIGAAAFDALAAAMLDPDLEISTRATHLLRQIKIDFAREDDDPEVQKRLQNYARLDENNRQNRIALLGELPLETALPALLRLARYEASLRLAKQAAMAIIDEPLYLDDEREPRRTAILAGLGDTQRPAAQWLRAYAASLPGGQAAAAAASGEFQRFIERERLALVNNPTITSGSILASLLRLQARLLHEAERPDELADVALALVEVTPATQEDLVRLFAWLKEHRAWDAVTAARDRFADAINADGIVLYALADARRVQGDVKAAVEIAASATALPGDDPRERLRLAFYLREYGLLDAAEKEFGEVIRQAPLNHLFSLQARWLLAEMLHDGGRHKDAAHTLADAVAGMEKNVADGQAHNNAERDPAEVRARMNYFYSEHYAGEGPEASADQRLEYLEKAVEADPTDADALIGLYRLASQPEERRRKTKRLIDDAAEKFRRQMADDANDPSPCNQLAWLVGNTEGDFQEAIRASQKSLRLRPGTAAYLDTLARCYFAAGDLKNAVRHQRMAIEREPHSRQMKRQLEVFEQAAEEASKQ